MADEPDLAAHAGVARFPRDRSDLTTTTRCPGCFEPLTRVPCTVCGLDVAHPVAAELALVSADAARLLDERLRLIGRIRLDTEHAAQRAAAREAQLRQPTAPATVSRPPSTTRVDVPVPAAAPASTPVPVPGPETREPAQPRRSSVQILLLVVGVSLVSVAAVFFLVYAFINYGLAWRTAIIGAVTVAAFVTASLLRRRRLRSTAEGIAAFAVVLVYLDVFAVRANDLLSAGSAEPLTYWGAALALSSAGLLLWHRVSGLRVARIAAFLAVAPGAGLLAAGVTPFLGTLDRTFIAFLAAALAGLVHLLAGGRGAERVTPEHIIALSLAAGALAVAFPLSFAVRPGTPWAAPLALLGVATVAAAHVMIAARPAHTDRIVRLLRLGFAALSSLALGAAAVLAAYRLPTLEAGIVASACATAGLALALGLAAARGAARATAPPDAEADDGAAYTGSPTAARVAAIVASGVAVLALAVPACIAVIAATDLAVTSMLTAPWRAAAGDRVAQATPALAASVLALAAVLALVVGSAGLLRSSSRVGAVIRWSLPALAVLAVPLLGATWAVGAGWLLLAAAGVVTLVGTRGRPWSTRLPWAALALVAAALGYAASWASTATWLAGSIVVVALLVGCRAALPGATAPTLRGRAVLLGAAVVVALVAVVAWGQHPAPAGDPDGRLLDSLRFAGLLAVVLVAASAFPLPGMRSAPDRRTVFALGSLAAVIALPAFAIAALITRDAPTALDEPVTSAATGALLVAGLGAWLLHPAGRALSAERATAALALPLALAWTLDSLLALAGASSGARSLAAVAAALLAAAAYLAVERATRGGLPRVAADAGVALVGASGVLLVVLTPDGAGWLALLLTSVTTLLLAIAPDGLLTSASPRRHLGWLALALATASLWWRLAETPIDAVEAYTLPLAGALLLVGLALWLAARRGAATPAPPNVVPSLTLLALLVAVVPSALATTGASDTAAGARPVVVAIAASALLLFGSLVRTRAAARPYLDAAAAAGGAGLVIVIVGRGIALAPLGLAQLGLGGERPDDARLDVWAAVGLVLLCVAAAGQASRRPGDSAVTPLAAEALLVTGLALVLLLESAGFGSASLGAPRAVPLILLFCAVYVAGAVLDRAPLSRIVGGIALAGAVLAGIVAGLTGAIDHIEWITVPVAAALLVTGARVLARTPAARSWPTLGPGVAVLLLPPLLATLVDRPLWRLVAIGVVAVAMVVAGARLRLQAPFVVGAVVAVVHGVATFTPQIRAVYELTEWWVWAGVGGIVIIVLAARYERSITAARDVVVRVGSLR